MARTCAWDTEGKFLSGGRCRIPAIKTFAPMPVLGLDAFVYHFMMCSLSLYLEASLLHYLLVLNAMINFLSKLSFLLMSSRKASTWEAINRCKGLNYKEKMCAGLNASISGPTLFRKDFMIIKVGIVLA